MPYPLNLHSAVSLLYLNKTGGEKQTQLSHKFLWEALPGGIHSLSFCNPTVLSAFQCYSTSFFQAFICSSNQQMHYDRVPVGSSGKQRLTRESRCPLAWSMFWWESSTVTTALQSCSHWLSLCHHGSDGDGPRAEEAHTLKRPDISQEAWEGHSVQVTFQLGIERSEAALG